MDSGKDQATGKAGIVRHLVEAAISAVLAFMPLLSARAGDLARIYVYVQSETPARSWFSVSCDGAVAAKITRGRFFAIDVAPGRHMLSDEKGIPVSVDARSGQESFVRLEWRNGELGGPALPVWEVVPAAVARRDMVYLRYIDANKAASRSVPKADPRAPPRLIRRDEAEHE